MRIRFAKNIRENSEEIIEAEHDGFETESSKCFFVCSWEIKTRSTEQTNVPQESDVPYLGNVYRQTATGRNSELLPLSIRKGALEK